MPFWSELDPSLFVDRTPLPVLAFNIPEGVLQRRLRALANNFPFEWVRSIAEEAYTLMSLNLKNPGFQGSELAEVSRSSEDTGSTLAITDLLSGIRVADPVRPDVRMTHQEIIRRVTLPALSDVGPDGISYARGTGYERVGGSISMSELSLVLPIAGAQGINLALNRQLAVFSAPHIYDPRHSLSISFKR